jgi:DNA polymerase-4
MSPHLNSLTSNDVRWLYVDFNSYFASVEQQLRPELRGRPVAVVPVETDATSAIAASYEAKAFGIRTGTPIWEAKKRCPDLVCVLANHEHYLDYHHRILVEVDRHIPITMVCSIDEVACRMMDNEIPRAIDIAHQIKHGLAQNVGEYVKCSIGIAPNRYLAKVATDLKKPDGLTIMTAEQASEKLARLSLRDLPGIGFNMEKRLNKAGLHHVSQLWALEPHQMRKVWGSVLGEKMWYYLRGVELPDEETTRSTIGHSHVLAPELREPVKARFVARRLTLKVASRLRRMGYFASSIQLAVRLENGPRLEQGIRFYRAQDSMTFLNLLDQAWANLIGEAKGVRIKKISVSVYGLEAEGALQQELFAELPEAELRQRQRSERMSRALDAINQKYGRDSVSIGMLPAQGRSFSGTKIAFTRIPDKQEFLE